MENLLQSSLRVGGSGSGKSKGFIRALLNAALNKTAAIVLMDKHGTLAKEFALQLAKRGCAHRLRYDQFSEFDKLLACCTLNASTDPNPLKREAQNKMRIIGFVNNVQRASQREGDNFYTMPMMSTGLNNAARIILHRAKPVSPIRIADLFELGTPECLELVNTTTDRQAKEQWKEYLALKRSNNYNLLDQKMGASSRVIKLLWEFPAFRERLAGTLNVRECLKQKLIIVLDGSNDGSVPDEVVTAIYGMWNMEIYKAQMQHLAETGEPLPTIVVWEEAAAVKMIGPVEENILREGRKAGFFPHILTQDLQFQTPETQQVVMGNTKHHRWYNPGDPKLAMIGGEDIALAQLDPYFVHRVTETERVILDLEGEPDEKVSKSVTKGEKGSSSTTTKTITPKQKIITDKKIEDRKLTDQILLKATDLLKQNAGEYHERIRGLYVSQSVEYASMLPEPYPEHEYGKAFIRKKLEKTIAASKEKPEFHSPTVSSGAPCPPATTNSGKSGMIPSDDT